MSDGFYVGVPMPSVVYIGCPDRAEFDKIGADAKDYGLDENGNHVIVKCIEGAGNEPGRPVKVIFQHWVAQETTEHMIERYRREGADKDHRASTSGASK